MENDTSKTPQDVPLPEPHLLTLASGLAAQAMVSMGVFPNPTTGKAEILLNQSRHLIATIAMLDERTRADQSEEERKTFDGILHELRMIFVAAQKEKERRDAEQPAE